MEEALATHDRIMTEAIIAHGGYIFATGGDSFSVAFGSAQDAAQAAIEAQRDLNQNDWGETPINVRMAVHTGESEERDGDYFGSPLNRAARLLAIGHGGQVLLSNATAALVGGTGLSVTDLGSHGLKDLSEPEQVFQLSEDGGHFPPLRSLNALPNNLPVQLTSFVGREDQLVEVAGLIRSNRMLTLTGVGGSGKTRLGLQAAGDLIDEFSDGVWFIELAPVDDPGLVPQAVIDGMDVAVGSEGPAIENLESFLERRHLLLILDNCEHVLDAVSEMAHRFMRAAPKLHILATSREGLAIDGERTWRVPSMRLADDPDDELVKGMQSEAVRLFAERASQVHPGFQVSNETASHIARVCRRLDGMPLAIELAAARTKVLPVDEIAQRLDDRFRLLTGGRRSSMERQQTLLATVKWSYELLSDKEKLLFARLGVFRGGFNLQAAEAVCSGVGIDDIEVLDLLSQLSDKSLVVPESGARGVQRFRMLETLRQFSLDQLVDSGEIDDVSRRHADHFLAYAEKAEPLLETSEMAEWLNRLEVDHDNLRAALEWLHESGDSSGALRLTIALSVWFWFLHRHHEEAYQWHQRTLAAAVDEPDELLGRAYAKGSMQAVRIRDFERATDWAQTALRLAGDTGDERSQVIALWTLGDAAIKDYDFETALHHFHQALSKAEESGDEIWICRVCSFICWMLQSSARVEEAREFAERSLAVGRNAGWPMGIAEAADTTAEFAIRDGDFVRAFDLASEALAIELTLNDPWNIFGVHATFALAQRLKGDAKGAAATALEGLTTSSRRADLKAGWPLILELAAALLDIGEIGDAAKRTTQLLQLAVGESGKYWKANGLLRAGSILEKAEEHAHATAAFAAADRLFEESSRAEPWLLAEQERHVVTARDALGADEFARLWEEGRSLGDDEALEKAIGWLDGTTDSESSS